MTKKEFRTKIRQATGSTGKDTATRVRGLRKVLAIAIFLAGSATMCFAQETGVVINGVTWATRNVDDPGKFAAKPESAGKFYQWNRKKGYETETPMIMNQWDKTTPEGTEWRTANDPSPTGWRIPTKEEFESLLNETKVKGEWDESKQGITFTDLESGASIFLPALGSRKYDMSTLVDKGSRGCYWSSTIEAGEAHSFKFGKWGERLSSESGSGLGYGYIIRSVSITPPAETKAENKQQSADPSLGSDIIGVWKGTYGEYYAPQGKATLTVNNDMTGVFEFTNDGVSGSYKVSVNFSNGTYRVKGTEWIVQPSYFDFFNFEGKISSNTFSGSDFKLEKQN